MTETPPNELVPGRTYKIEMFDCCVEGEFTATFVRADDDRFVFDNGHIGPEWGGFTFTEVADQ